MSSCRVVRFCETVPALHHRRLIPNVPGDPARSQRQIPFKNAHLADDGVKLIMDGKRETTTISSALKHASWLMSSIPGAVTALRWRQ